MLKLFLSLKYLRKKKIVFLSIIAVALSVALLSTVASLFTGFIFAIQSSASDYLGDIVLEPPVRFQQSNKFVELLNANESIAASSPALSVNGLLHLGKGNVKAVSIWGINPKWRAEVTSLKKTLVRQSNLKQDVTFAYNDTDENYNCFAGIGLVADLKAGTDEYDFKSVDFAIGKPAVITIGSAPNALSQQAQLTIQAVSKKVTITDIVFTGVHDVDKRFVFLPIQTLSDMLGLTSIGNSPPADVVHIKCVPGTDPKSVLPIVKKIWDDFARHQLGWPDFSIAQTTTITAVEKQSQYITELRKQMGMLLLIFGIVSFGVIVLVFCIFYMIVISKLKDLAIIKSTGASSLTIAMIFLVFGSVIGIIGAFLGIAIGYIVTQNINAIEKWIQTLFGLKLWDSSVYIFNIIPNKFNFSWALCFAAAAVIASILGAVIPAIVAARTIPSKILRYE